MRSDVGCASQEPAAAAGPDSAGASRILISLWRMHLSSTTASNPSPSPFVYTTQHQRPHELLHVEHVCLYGEPWQAQ